LNGRLARLRPLDELRDPGQRRIGTDAGRAYDEVATDVDRSADDRVARADLDRRALTVMIDVSIADDPLSTTPSVAISSPGRAENRSPTPSLSIGTATSCPSPSDDVHLSGASRAETGSRRRLAFSTAVRSSGRQEEDGTAVAIRDICLCTRALSSRQLRMHDHARLTGSPRTSALQRPPERRPKCRAR